MENKDWLEQHFGKKPKLTHKPPYKFIVISDDPHHPIHALKQMAKLRNDIPKDIKDYIMSLDGEYYGNKVKRNT